MVETLVEQRKDARMDLSWPISVWMPKAKRFVNARSANISKGGVYFKLPITSPVKEGNIVEINFPRGDKLAEEKGTYARIKCGKVIRVERRNMIRDANIGVAVKFEKE